MHLTMPQHRPSLEVITERINGHCLDSRALSFIYFFLKLAVILGKPHEFSGHLEGLSLTCYRVTHLLSGIRAASEVTFCV